MGKDVIIACDFNSKSELYTFLDKFKDQKPFLKVGMELFYAEGPEIVREIKRRGHKIFLDLKLHDIPTTVKKSMHVLSSLAVDMCNLHAAGTVDMMKAALEGLTRPDGTRPLLIAVTQLTSTDQERMENDLLIKEPIDKVVMHYAKPDVGFNMFYISPYCDPHLPVYSIVQQYVPFPFCLFIYIAGFSAAAGIILFAVNRIQKLASRKANATA